jgi:hypothetical protein
MSLQPPLKYSQSLEEFLSHNCAATKAKYAAELTHAGEPWRKPLDFRYAESLVFFGLLERMTRTFKRGNTVGSKSWFRKAPEYSPRACKSEPKQTEMEFA